MKTAATIVGMVVVALSVGFFFASSGVSALELPSYSETEFRAAQANGAPILVDVHASWCSTCRAQRRALEALVEDPRFADVVFFEIDYDTEKDIMRSFGASQRSTVIVFRGTTEVGRIIGDTRASSIEALLLSITR